MLERKLRNVVAPQKQYFPGNGRRPGDSHAGVAGIVAHQPQIVALRSCEMGPTEDFTKGDGAVIRSLRGRAAGNSRDDIGIGPVLGLRVALLVRCL